MTFPAYIIAVALLAATPLQTPDGADRTRSMNDDLRRLHSIDAGSAEPPETTVSPGDNAPNFSFESNNHQWMRLRDLLVQGNVLLLFGADDRTLTAVQRERDALLDRGVMPVAIMDRRQGAVSSAVRRLGLDYSVLADPQCVIAAQFNVLNPVTHHPTGSWFIIDRSGRVRGLSRNGLPHSGYVPLATSALGIPARGIILPSRAR